MKSLCFFVFLQQWATLTCIEAEQRRTSGEIQLALTTENMHLVDMWKPSHVRTAKSAITRTSRLTRSNFRFPSGHFLYNVTLDNFEPCARALYQ